MMHKAWSSIDEVPYCFQLWPSSSMNGSVRRSLCPSVRPSVSVSHLFQYVPIIVSSQTIGWGFRCNGDSESNATAKPFTVTSRAQRVVGLHRGNTFTNAWNTYSTTSVRSFCLFAWFCIFWLLPLVPLMCNNIVLEFSVEMYTIKLYDFAHRFTINFTYNVHCAVKLKYKNRFVT